MVELKYTLTIAVIFIIVVVLGGTCLITNSGSRTQTPTSTVSSFSTTVSQNNNLSRFGEPTITRLKDLFPENYSLSEFAFGDNNETLYALGQNGVLSKLFKLDLKSGVEKSSSLPESAFLDSILVNPEKGYLYVIRRIWGPGDGTTSELDIINSSTMSIIKTTTIPWGSIALNSNLNNIYIASTHTIYVLNGTTAENLSQIQIQIPNDSKDLYYAQAIAANPATDHVYVLGYYDMDWKYFVSKIYDINGSTNQIANIITINSTAVEPRQPIINPKNNNLYFLDFEYAGTPQEPNYYIDDIYELNTTTYALSKFIMPKNLTYSRIAINQNNNLVYAATSTAPYSTNPVIYTIDFDKGQIVKTVPLGNTTSVLFYNPLNNILYIS